MCCRRRLFVQIPLVLIARLSRQFKPKWLCGCWSDRLVHLRCLNTTLLPTALYVPILIRTWSRVANFGRTALSKLRISLFSIIFQQSHRPGALNDRAMHVDLASNAASEASGARESDRIRSQNFDLSDSIAQMTKGVQQQACKTSFHQARHTLRVWWSTRVRRPGFAWLLSAHWRFHRPLHTPL